MFMFINLHHLPPSIFIQDFFFFSVSPDFQLFMLMSLVHVPECGAKLAT